MQSQKQLKRAKRIRAKVTGTEDRPRLSVFRSNREIYAQLIDDVKGITLLGVSEKTLSEKKGTKIEKAKTLGETLAKLALKKRIKQVVFDKGSYAYHGRVKSLAEGAREGGLQF